MAYNKFTLKKVQQQFNLTINSKLPLFQNNRDVPISPWLTVFLKQFAPLALRINTEKARSEWIIAPILGELQHLLDEKITLFSGTTFDVDPKQDLTGVCDFIISRQADALILSVPLVTIVEAKNDNVMKGLGQVIATMVAAQIFNERENNPLETIYGVITTGATWKFLKLIGRTVYVDGDEYYLRDLEKIMGILTDMVLNQP